MARRVAYIRKINNGYTGKDIVHLDCGGFANFISAEGTIRTQTIIDVYEKIQITAVNISARELAHDADRFESLISDGEIPYISANIVERESNKARFQTHLIVERKGRKIAIIGVTEKVLRTWKTNDEAILQIVDPVERINPIVYDLRDEVDTIILMAHLPRRELAPILDQVPGIDLVLGADGYSTTFEIRSQDDTYVAYPGRQGQYLGSMEMRFANDRPELIDHKMVLLTLDMPEDPEIKVSVNEALAKIEAFKADGE